ncbi:kinase-like domain-containing protein [Mycotypha africana]|uniref:kinase-like domain-containing protein n=1 Tax=Mycotypha africana TaxID=64632 RepID=UPI00230067E0|nr:kinase-like domain-containing protein [Mycotypha africana]KAI8969129.1 kinase-like domain-containing protein [Mycotypha africana]
MEFIDSAQYSPQQQHNSTILKPMTPTTYPSTPSAVVPPHSGNSSGSSSSANGGGHHPRRSVSGMDILNGLKITTNTHLHHHTNINNNDTIPNTPVPSSATTTTTTTTTTPPSASVATDIFTTNTSFQNHFSPNHIEDFEITDPIGYGSSAIVYKAIYKPLDKPMALKEIDLDKFERNQIDELRRETALMALSKHPNVLRVYGSFVHGSKLYIVTPFLAGGSCLDIMKTKFPEGMDESSIATILKQTLEGLIYLHKNGHIHRDVKAGNLLVNNDDGTVLLADFGVSSSLMETGEKGMRKTFVGTPCWMAPEVMEQEAYDYKADIWSFGITALELATGHAPFAKYPPLKVLMMTLASEPPTLDREHTYHRYSKTFKDMIDMCLVKDPTKRPTADKLILHPFFKQAKRKEHLLKTILSDLPPLEQRPRKRLPKNHLNNKTAIKQFGDSSLARNEEENDNDDEWNFDDDEDTNIDENNRSDSHAQENTKSTIKPITSSRQQQTKKHISFGDVIVKGNSSTSNDNMTHPSDNYNNNNNNNTTTTGMMTSPSILSGSTPPTIRKSRFVIEEAAADPSTATGVEDEERQLQLQSSLSMHKMPSHDNISSSSTSSDRIAATKPSRFEVSSSMIYQSVPLSRDSSSYSSTSTSTTTAAAPIPPNNTAAAAAAIHIVSSPPLSVTRDKKVSAVDDQLLMTADQHQQQQSRKIGRFELTSNANNDLMSVTSSNVSRHGSFSDHNQFSSPQLPPSHHQPHHHQHSQSISVSSLSSHPLHGSLLTNPYYQIEELLRINDSQRQLLQDIYSNFNAATTASFVAKKPSSNIPTNTVAASNNNVNEELLATIDHLENLIQQRVKENDLLRKENEDLRYELEILKQ